MDIEIDNNGDAMAVDRLFSDDPSMRPDGTDKENTPEEDAKVNHAVNDAEDIVKENDEAGDRQVVNGNAEDIIVDKAATNGNEDKSEVGAKGRVS